MPGTKLDRLRSRLAARESGYVAILTALLMTVMIGMLAFAVDVGRWYVVGQQEQRAADAAALAGVTSLPGDPTTAYATARKFASINTVSGPGAVTVDAAVADKPTRLRVTITKTVDNIFGPLLGVSQTTVSRTAVADYAGPVPMGSPCNEFGDDPDPQGRRSTNCPVRSDFWANVGSIGATKVSGDAYQDKNCSSSPVPDRCSGTNANTDYDPNGYFYSVTPSQTVTNLQIEAFDPALIDVGDLCDKNGLSGAAGTIYEKGSSSPYCTGDVRYGGTGEVSTQFTVRQADANSNPWNPMTYPPIGGSCTQTFPGYSGSLSDPSTYPQYVTDTFRKWVTLCSIPNASAGQIYFIQVKTNGVGNDLGNGHNRFGLRAYDPGGSLNGSIALSAFNKMAIYANLPSATTNFYLARVPTNAAGKTLNVQLFDVGDVSSGGSGTIKVVPPVGSGVTFANCVGTGPAAGALPTCSISASSSFNGRWQSIAVPIPTNYSCVDTDPTQCWVRLQYSYPGQPSDTTSWTASIEGDPVRLVQ